MRKFEFVKEDLKKNNTSAFMPKRATISSAGYDFYSPIDVTILPNTAQMIWSDIKAQFNANEVLITCVTSGMGKRGLILANGIGVIDCDYYGNENNDGNIGFMLRNVSDNTIEIKAGDKIGQGIFTTFLTIDDEEEITNKRVGGFGSTDKK